ncbi:hypothetical protein BBJ28_00005328 [Nothophytophthora sp. Chile5]|nr:hypothetical protein BBJ28_00005328 [Nothophytophthora sp. Chile5]
MLEGMQRRCWYINGGESIPSGLRGRRLLFHRLGERVQIRVGVRDVAARAVPIWQSEGYIRNPPFPTRLQPRQTKSGDMADEVAALRRELETLRMQLEQERRKSCTDSSSQGPGIVHRRNESQPRSDVTAARPSPEEQRIYVQHVPVDSKRGKWWLRDRQALSHNVPTSVDDCAVVKVRETWQWSGRTVILDKIVLLSREQHDEGGEGEETQAQESGRCSRLDTEHDTQNNSLGVSVTTAPTAETASDPNQLTEEANSIKEIKTEGEAATDSPVAVEQLEAPTPVTKGDDEVRESSPPSEHASTPAS